MKLIELVQGRARAYRLVFEPVPEGGGYVVTCPALPGLVVDGDTLKEALERSHDAMERRLRTLIAQGREVPEGEVLFAHSMHV